MRIWHEQLIPKLCRQHLLGQWREALGCYKIVTNQVNGGSYRNHPQTKAFLQASDYLWHVLKLTREEMVERGYNPQPLPQCVMADDFNYQEWQTLDEQIAILKAKGCDCQI